MMLLLFAIRDDKVEAFMGPTVFQTRGQAIRWFGDVMKDPQGELGKHAEDYKLMYLGMYNASSGVIEGDPSGPQFVISGLDVIGGV